MSRSEYSNDCDIWDLIRWRGAVTSALRGKRGQAFLREMETALLELPKKELVEGDFANQNGVCALGSVALRRKVKSGVTHEEAMKQIVKEWPQESEECGDIASSRLGIARAMAKEIMFLNDDDFFYSREKPQARYERILKWVRDKITEVAKK